MKRGDLGIGVSRRAFLTAGAGFGLFNIVPSSVLGADAPSNTLNVAQIVLVITAVLACHSLGITAMVIAFACINIFWLLAWQFFASKLIGYSYLQMLRDLMPFMFISLAVMAVTWLITKPIGNIYLLMAAQVIVAVLFYVLAMRLSGAKIYAESVGYFSDLFKRK